jgi:RimJ/RimL family protein N-acetyltransferase
LSQRREYFLQFNTWVQPLSNSLPAGICVRTPTHEDRPPLAELMLESYRDTIDFDGETLLGAFQEIEHYLSPESADSPMLDQSILLTSESTIVSACLVSNWHSKQCPLISYVMSLPKWKHRGLATHALRESLRRLSSTDSKEVRAIITQGNLPSEQLFSKMGFNTCPPLSRA